jgi:valyl-tRNA synthetase
MPVEEMTLPDGRKANSSPKFDQGRNFCNKLWNAARFAMSNIQGAPAWSQASPARNISDAWILSRLNATIRDVTSAISAYRFHDATDALYRYMWNDFCDWYLEISKVRINAGDATPRAILAHALDVLLRLLHPVMPFITEAIWEQLNAVAPNRGPTDSPAERMLATAAWPRAESVWIAPALEDRFAVLQAVVGGIREARNRHNVPASKKVRVTVACGGDDARLIQDSSDIIRFLAGAEEVAIDLAARPTAADATVMAGGMQAFVRDVVDRDAELGKLTKRQETLAKGIAAAEGKLNNPKFRDKAPADLVARETERLAAMKDELSAVVQSLELLK